MDKGHLQNVQILQFFEPVASTGRATPRRRVDQAQLGIDIGLLFLIRQDVPTYQVEASQRSFRLDTLGTSKLLRLTESPRTGKKRH